MSGFRIRGRPSLPPTTTTLALSLSLISMFVNITETAESRQALSRVRQETIRQARELMDHQIALAQDVASMLGKSTAHSELLLESLIGLADADTPDQGPTP